ncbi:MAG: hypothetical protein E7Z91_01105 [Cyanobacteria bacterium SIG30]|nr:hypothetical protein [Cyanobacteria bacterium SIG30]
MITLDIDLSYLFKHFGISAQKVNLYSNKNIEEVMEAEAKEGNKKAENYTRIFEQPEELVEFLKLTDATNRFLIIRNLNDDDLKGLLQYLGSDDLIWGLQYFSIDKLVELMSELPQEELLKLVMEKFSMEEIVAMMKTEEMDEFLTGEKLDRNHIMDFFKQLDEQRFKKLMFQVMGPEVLEQDRKTTLANIDALDDKAFNRMLEKFENKGKKMIIFGILYNKPEYIKEFKNETIARPFEFVEKGEILKSMKTLDPEFLIPMVEELPKDLIQVVATQIDPMAFAEVLSKDFQNILSEIAF